MSSLKLAVQQLKNVHARLNSIKEDIDSKIYEKLNSGINHLLSKPIKNIDVNNLNNMIDMANNIIDQALSLNKLSDYQVTEAKERMEDEKDEARKFAAELIKKNSELAQRRADVMQKAKDIFSQAKEQMEDKKDDLAEENSDEQNSGMEQLIKDFGRTPELTEAIAALQKFAQLYDEGGGGIKVDQMDKESDKNWFESWKPEGDTEQVVKEIESMPSEDDHDYIKHAEKPIKQIPVKKADSKFQGLFSRENKDQTSAYPRAPGEYRSGDNISGKHGKFTAPPDITTDILSLISPKFAVPELPKDYTDALNLVSEFEDKLIKHTKEYITAKRNLIIVKAGMKQAFDELLKYTNEL